MLWLNCWYTCGSDVSFPVTLPPNVKYPWLNSVGVFWISLALPTTQTLCIPSRKLVGFYCVGQQREIYHSPMTMCCRTWQWIIHTPGSLILILHALQPASAPAVVLVSYR